MRNGKVPLPVVLIVEGDPLLKVLTTDIVQEAGFMVLSASNTHQALDILAARSDIAVLLTDIILSKGMGGLRLAHIVRERWAHIQIIGVSTNRRVSEADLPAGSRCFTKPYNTDALIHALGGFAGNRFDRPSKNYLDA